MHDTECAKWPGVCRGFVALRLLQELNVGSVKLPQIAQGRRAERRHLKGRVGARPRNLTGRNGLQDGGCASGSETNLIYPARSHTQIFLVCPSQRLTSVAQIYGLMPPAQVFSNVGLRLSVDG
jgi:hypothetical protein